MISPGIMKAAKLMPSISVMREPMAAPKTTKYSMVVTTGETML